jgi:RimJ/RimL family protein N-acetyltransferase
MRHNLELEGNRFALRPVDMGDAEFIVRLRGDQQLNRYIHASSNRVEDQEQWLGRYMDRPGDWYFVIVDKVTGDPQGTIGIYEYDENMRSAEWGRWIVRPGSLAAIESAVLIYRAAFESLGLNAVYCRTVADNKTVVSFHDSSGAPRHRLLQGYFERDGQTYDCIEHHITRETWDSMRSRMERLATRIAVSIEG